MTVRLADVSGEAVLLAGAGRAILLQIAHPAVGRGVARHSDFSSDPLRRLRNTLTYVYVVVYGTPEEVARIARAVNATHVQVRGDQYDASDPDLQLWVAATLYQTAIEVYERVVGPLPPEDVEQLYRDYAVLGTTLTMSPGLWPKDTEAFRKYWLSTLATLRVDDEVLAVSRALLHPTGGPWWIRRMMPLVRLITAGLLDESLRTTFELPWDARRQRRFDRTMRMMARTNRILPARLRHWPREHYLARFRRA
ncbi:MAG: oxygenase MpaB family protein [Terrimesophilobacter sp.]